MSDLTYAHLAKMTAELAKDINRGSDRIAVHAAAIRDEADDAGRIAEGITSLGVDSATIAETTDLSKTMTGVSEAAVSYASMAAVTARSAQAAHDQNKTSHQGIGEAVARSTVGREIYDLDRTWLTQE